jgi:hypothetical protein
MAAEKRSAMGLCYRRSAVIGSFIFTRRVSMSASVESGILFQVSGSKFHDVKANDG